MSKLTDEVLASIEGRRLVTKYRTPDKEVYVGFQSDWGAEVVEVQSKRFHDWLRCWVWQHAHISLSRGDCAKIGQVLESTALNDTRLEERRVYTRVGWHAPSKTLYIDLMNDERDVLQITAGPDGKVQYYLAEPEEMPLVFSHGDSAQPLPRPRNWFADGTTLDDLMASVLPPGITPKQRVLITAWLLGALHPTGPYPILALGGEPGSAKSFTCKLLRAIIDPAMPQLLSGIESTRDLVVAAKHTYVLAFDNLSKLSKAQSDRLCRLATGAGIARRSLYTNDELHALDVKRPVLLNGIGEVLTEADVLDRCIQIHLPRLADDAREAETDLWARFEENRPEILWHLTTAVGAALARMSQVELPANARPRMVDFAKWVVGAEEGAGEALGWAPGTFLAAYDESRAEVADQAIVASLPVQALICWMQDRERQRQVAGRPVAWSGRAQELDKALRGVVREHGGGTRPAEWPRNPNVLKAHLQTAAAPLRRLGLDIETRTEGKRRLRITHIRPCGPMAWQTYPTFAGAGLGADCERDADADSGFRAAFAASNPVSAAHRLVMRRSGYSDVEIDGLTDAVAASIVAAFEAWRPPSQGQSQAEEEEEGDAARIAASPVGPPPRAA